MLPLFCDACGDNVKAVYPCKFVFFDGRIVDLNICPNCMKYGKLTIDLPRTNLVSMVLKTWKAQRLWRQRRDANKTEKV